MFTRYIKDNGCIVCHAAPPVRLSKKSEDAGMDIVVSEGWEAGGDNAFDDVTSLVLITQVVQSVKMPVVAAGGIGDARGFIGALTMGTEGEQMGTHFAATRECVANPNFKRSILNAKGTDTVVTGRRVGPVCMIKNDLSQQVLEWEFSLVLAKNC